jgi:hypothetical protein
MSSSLTEIVLPQRPPHMPCPTTVTDGDRRSLFVALEAVADPRDPRGRRYPLVAILAAAVCAVIAGACTFAAVSDWVRFQDRTVWARARLRGPGARRDDGVAAADPYRRCSVVAGPGPLAPVLGGAGPGRRPMVAPGHRRRREGRAWCPAAGWRQVHLLSAYDTSTGIVLAQVQIPAKSRMKSRRSPHCCAWSKPC